MNKVICLARKFVWHRLCQHRVRVVNDSSTWCQRSKDYAYMVSVQSTTTPTHVFLLFPKYNNFLCVSIAVDNADTVSAQPLTTLTHVFREYLCETVLSVHTWVSPRWSLFIKQKKKGRKSRDTVPLKILFALFRGLVNQSESVKIYSKCPHFAWDSLVTKSEFKIFMRLFLYLSSNKE